MPNTIVKAIPVEIPKLCSTSHSAFQLSNGLRVISIQDINTTRSAVAMAVGVGCNHDVPELPGLAHFCEHMLFLGTERNRGEGEYHKWVQEHGGHSNAWTEDGATVFFFDAQADAVESEGLALFLHFFVCPLLSESGLEREVQAVHSEDEKNHSVDYWCQQEIIKLHLANPQHPYGRYGNGNRQTLWDLPRSQGVNIRERLLDFYKAYYVASNMTLAIYSPLSVERVKELVTPILSKVPVGSHAANGTPEIKPFSKGGGIWINQKGNTSNYELSIAFPMPFGEFDVARQPSRFASHVLGHECQGSLLDVLRSRSFATAVSAGAHSIDAHHSLFGITIELSVEGLANVDLVLELVFKSIAFLRDVISTNDELLSEMVDCAELSFQFSEIGDQTRHTASMARNSQHYGVPHAWPYAKGVVRELCHADLDKVTGHLSPQNSFVILKVPDVDLAVGKDENHKPLLPVARFPTCGVPTTEKTQHHSTVFGKSIIPNDVQTRWCFPHISPLELKESGFLVPKLNPYVTRSFDTSPLSNGSNIPVEHPITSSTPNTFRYKLDNKFDTPKGSLRVLLSSPRAYRDPLSHYFTVVASTILEHRLTDLLYFATLASLNCRILPAVHGLMLIVSGPREHLARVTSDILTEALSTVTEEKPELYAVYSERLVQDLVSTRVEQPYQKVVELARGVLQFIHWSDDDVLKAACGSSTLSLEQSLASLPPFSAFCDFTKSFWSEGLNYDALLQLNGVQRNIDEQCQKLQKTTTKAFASCSEEALPRARDVLDLPRRDSLVPPPAFPEGFASLAIRGGDKTQPATFSTVSLRSSENPNDPNCAAIVTMQLGVRSARVEALTTMLSGILSAPFFDTLRTSETLGYVVHHGTWMIHAGAHLRFLAQSDKFSTLYTLSRVLAFIRELPQVLSMVTPSGFEEVRTAQIALRKDTPKSLGSEASFWWERRHHPEGFEHREREIEVLKKLKLDELLRFADEHLSLASDAVRANVSLLVPHGDDSVKKALDAAKQNGNTKERTVVVLELPEREKQKPEMVQSPPLTDFKEHTAVALEVISDIVTWRAELPCLNANIK